jgi:hypothetical protein
MSSAAKVPAIATLICGRGELHVDAIGIKALGDRALVAFA